MDKNETNKLKYKIIFSDLDQTLLVNNHIPDFNLEAINKARNLGVKFVISTGREFNVMSHLLKELKIDESENEYTICGSGCKIYENKNKKLIYIKSIPLDIIKQLFEFGKKYKEIFLLLDTVEGPYIYNPIIFEKEKNVKDSNYNLKYKKFETWDEIKDIKIIRIIYSCKNLDYLLKIQDDILKSKICENKVECYISVNRFLEFNALNINKGEALKWLCDYLKINLNESIAIGDNYNDESMIKIAGIGACVKSANDDIKKISKYVCEKDYFEGSVKEVIEKFILN